MKIRNFLIVVIALSALFSINAQTITPASGAPAGEKPAPIVRGANGDIPDNQVFITFKAPNLLYELKVPEGWATTGKSDDVRMIETYNGIHVRIMDSKEALNVQSAKSTLVPDLISSGRAVTIKSISQIKKNAGPSIAIKFESNSDPNPVTGKQIRLEAEAYCFSNGKGKLAILILWAPYGADNVDQWNLISDSFRWL